MNDAAVRQWEYRNNRRGSKSIGIETRVTCASNSSSVASSSFSAMDAVSVPKGKEKIIIMTWGTLE